MNQLASVLKALIEFCDAVDDFAYHSELPTAKELRKKTEALRDSAEQVLEEAK
jgi:hypothetical protein